MKRFGSWVTKKIIEFIECGEMKEALSLGVILKNRYLSDKPRYMFLSPWNLSTTIKAADRFAKNHTNVWLVADDYTKNLISGESKIINWHDFNRDFYESSLSNNSYNNRLSSNRVKTDMYIFVDPPNWVKAQSDISDRVVTIKTKGS